MRKVFVENDRKMSARSGSISCNLLVRTSPQVRFIILIFELKKMMTYFLVFYLFYYHTFYPIVINFGTTF